MTKLKSISIFMLSSMIILTGCASKKIMNVESKYNIPGKVLDSSIDDISSANNKLAAKFFNDALKNNKDKNFIISPLSLNTILALTQNGAYGETKSEMVKAIELNGISDSRINEGYKNIIANYNSKKLIEIKMADSIWIRKGNKIADEFKNIGQNYYESEVASVDFSKNKTVDVINEWVSKHTAGKIKKMVENLNGNTFMVLMNTIYFKGSWQETFDKKITSKEKFTLSNKSVIDVNMMKKMISAEYIKGSNFQGVRLPYVDEDFGMYIFLPNNGISLEKAEENIDFKDWNNFTKGFQQRQVKVWLPKFKIEYEENLNKMLQSFGMNTAFNNEKANFSKLGKSDENIYIDLVKQKCYIDVDEAGTEAAAATEVQVLAGAAPAKDIVDFKVDRPFIYAIADKKTGLIVFMGKVEKPE